MEEETRIHAADAPQVELGGGSLRSSLKPEYRLIPLTGLSRIAGRFALGRVNYGEDNWKKSIHHSRESARAFADQAYNHGYEHLHRSACGIEPGDDHLAAVGWMVCVLAYVEEVYGCRWSEL